MSSLKPLAKKPNKNDRERKVLIGLIEHYLKTGKPVGSNTLKEMGFDDLSSATIRNYFAHLEEEGLLLQQHSSGGRIPTAKAFRLYATDCQSSPIETNNEPSFNTLASQETREITAFLQKAAELLSEKTNTAVFLSAPRLEQDFIIGIKLVSIDDARCLCVLITDFGQVLTEVLYTGMKIGTVSNKRIEAYFKWRLTGQSQPQLSKEEEDLAQRLYNELMVRYIVSYSNFESEIYRTGFSTLLSYQEFHDPSLLANGLNLFENTHGMRQLLKECITYDSLKFWIGEDLTSHCQQPNSVCSVVAIPYYVNKQPVGAVGLLGPMRLAYKSAFCLLHQFSEEVSEALTHNLYKFKITMRPPKTDTIDYISNTSKLIEIAKPQLRLEDHRTKQKNPSRRK